jgi:hypothetical protein
MKNTSTISNAIKFASILFLFFTHSLKAQLPHCNDSIIYLLTGANISKFNPYMPITATNPSTYIPAPFVGISLNNNLNGGPSPTFYGVDGSGIYSWWNGSAWVTTPYSSGSTTAVNPGGAGCYIYNLVGGIGQIYRYDGTSNGILITTVSSFSGGGPFDLAGDVDGNFYLLKTVTPQYLNLYNSSGTQLMSYTMTGMPSVGAGGGFAVNGTDVFVFNASGFFKGTISGSVVNFTNIASTFVSTSDVANCPSFGVGVHAFSSSGPLSCTGGSVTLQATGWVAGTMYSWSGPGLSGAATNSTALATSAGMYSCTITSPGGCPTILTTSVTATGGSLSIAVNPSNPTICLGGSITLIASGATSYTWSPSSSLSSANGSSVVASPTTSTVYTITANSGSCTATPQSVIVNVSLCTNVNESKENTAILSLFPNPNKGSMNVKGTAEVSLNISDELGRVVKVLELNSENDYETQVQGLKNGFYFLSDNRTGKSLNVKIVVITD